MLHMSGAPGALLGSFMTLRLPMCMRGTEVYTIVSNGLRLTIERKASLANSKSHNKVLLYAVILKFAALITPYGTLYLPSGARSICSPHSMLQSFALKPIE